jgi:hypothetical protein
MHLLIPIPETGGGTGHGAVGVLCEIASRPGMPPTPLAAAIDQVDAWLESSARVRAVVAGAEDPVLRRAAF